jgi:hypothetical protein
LKIYTPLSNKYTCKRLLKCQLYDENEEEQNDSSEEEAEENTELSKEEKDEINNELAKVLSYMEDAQKALAKHLQQPEVATAKEETESTDEYSTEPDSSDDDESLSSSEDEDDQVPSNELPQETNTNGITLTDEHAGKEQSAPTSVHIPEPRDKASQSCLDENENNVQNQVKMETQSQVQPEVKNEIVNLSRAANRFFAFCKSLLQTFSNETLELDSLMAKVEEMGFVGVDKERMKNLLLETRGDLFVAVDRFFQ